MTLKVIHEYMQLTVNSALCDPNFEIIDMGVKK